MAEIELHPIHRRLVEFEAQLRQFDERQAAIEDVLYLLLAQLPGDDALRLLSRSANELDLPESRQSFAPTIQLLDELRARLAALDGRGETPPTERL